MSSFEYVDSPKAKISIKSVHETTEIVRKNSENFGEKSHLFDIPAKGLLTSSPGTYVVELNDARIIGRNGHVVTNDNYLLEDLSHELGTAPLQHSIYQRRNFPNQNVLRGKSLLVSAHGASNNYFHWLFDLIPKFEILRKGGVDLADFDYLLVSGSELPFQIQSLKMLEVALEKIIWLDDSSHYKVDELTATSLPGVSGNIPHWVVSYLKSAFIDTSTSEMKFPSKVLIARSDAKNKRQGIPDSVIQVFKDNGYQELELSQYAFADQIQLFNEATHIAGSHGAGFSNIVFSQKNTKVLEVFDLNYINQCYWTLSSHVGLSYNYFIMGQNISKANMKIMIEEYAQMEE